MKIIKALSFILLLIIHSLLSAADILAKVDKTQVILGESFSLILSSKQPLINQMPDLAPLAKSFRVLGIHKQSHQTISNGNRTEEYSWIIRLMPRSEGKLTIPSLNFSQYQTPSISIQVISREQANEKGTTSNVFIETSIDQPSVYVQSQLTYTVKLFFSRQLDGAQLSSPTVEHALILPIGEDKSSQQERDGTLYQVIERNYAIFPQQSGELLIEAPIFTAIIIGSQSQNTFESYLSRREPIQLTADSQSASVKPIPLAAEGQYWLPAKKLSLKEKWSSDINQLKVGEPITRTIQLIAHGAMAAQLPDIQFSTVSQLNQYANTEQAENYIEDSQIVAERIEKVVYIPNADGEFKLAAVNIPWWNTVTDQAQIASLPEHIVTATGSIAESLNPTNTESPFVTESNRAESSELPNEMSLWRNIPWLIAAIFFLLWLSTKLPISKIFNKKITKKTTISQKSVIKQLKQACDSNDASACSRHFIQWAKLQWPNENINHLLDGEVLLHNTQLNQQLKKLNEVLYDNGEHGWDGSLFWHAFRSMELQPKKQAKQSDLPNLYP